MAKFYYGNQFFDSQEDVNAYILEEEFNKQMNWFTKLNRHPKFEHIDYDGIDRKGRKVHIELKQRNGTIEQFQRFGDVLIEPTKAQAFAQAMESGYTLDEQRLYINWVDDGAIIYTFKGEVIPILYYLNHPQKNYGKCLEKENEDRFGLPIEYATIYKKDDNGLYILTQKGKQTKKREFKRNCMFN